MNIQEDHIANYNSIKESLGMKEYIFMTEAGYRHFFVLGKNLQEAELNFMRIDEIKRCGFTLNDLPIRLEYDKEKTKNWSLQDFILHNQIKIPNGLHKI